MGQHGQRKGGQGNEMNNSSGRETFIRLDHSPMNDSRHHGTLATKPIGSQKLHLCVTAPKGNCDIVSKKRLKVTQWKDAALTWKARPFVLKSPRAPHHFLKEKDNSEKLLYKQHEVKRKQKV